jgi:iron complex outermembrane receptor protein
LLPQLTATRRSGALVGLCLALAWALPARANPPEDFTSLSLEQLLEVTIVGASKYEQTQVEVAAAVSVITHHEIKAFGWRTLGEALASLPGVYATYDRQYSYLGMRGFGLPGDLNTRVLVTIDGNRVNEPIYDSGPTGREFPLDVDLIERIEFIPGPGGAVYGQNAMFGVVNVVTRSGAGVGGAELVASVERLRAQREGRASWGKRLDNGVDVLVSLSGMHARGQDGFADFGASGASGPAVGLDGERVAQFFARVSRGAWSFEHVDGKHRKDDPTGSFLSDPLVAGSYQGDRFTLTQLQFQEGFIGNTLQLSARLFVGSEHYRSSLSFGTVFLSPADSEWHGAEVRLLSTALAGHKLMLGVEAQDNTRQDQAALDLANPANNLLVARSGYRIGLYAQDEWRIAETVAATLGMRVDRNNVTGSKLSPRAALIWRATPQTTLKALYGRAHRAPTVYERDYGDDLTQVPNLALNGETIDTVELVVDHRVGRDLTLRGSVYEWTMRDIVTLGIDPVSGLSQYQSGKTIKAQGLELSADKTWVSGARLRGSVSVQDVAPAGGGEQLNSPKLLGKLNLSAPLPWAGMRAGYALRYDGKRRSLNGSMLGGYALSNLTLSTDTLAHGLEVSVGIVNLFDKHYAHPGSDTNWQNAFEQDGRSVRIQLGFRY